MRRWWLGLNGFLNKHEVVLVLLLIVVVLRLPSLFEPFWYGDENIYLAIGQSVGRGEVLYRDITDYPNKPPAIYLLAALVGGVASFRLVLLVWMLGTTWAMFEVLRLLVKKVWASVVGTLLFIGLTSTPIVEGNIANAEIFFIGPSIAAAWLLLKANTEKKGLREYGLSLAAGVMLGLGFLFKIHVLFDIVALGLYFFVFIQFKKLSVKSGLEMVKNKAAWLFVLGLVVPIGVALIWLATLGVSSGFLMQNAAESSKYVSAWSQQEWIKQILGLGMLEARLAVVAVVVTGLFWFRKRLNKKLLLALLWLILSLFATLLSARPYPHYLIQVVPALVIGVTLVMYLKGEVVSKVVFGVFVVLVGLAIVRFGFGTYPVVRYYANFVEYINGKVDRTEFYARFDRRVPRNYELVKVITQMTGREEKIYVWGSDPEVYVMSGRLPEGPLVASFHVADLNYYQDTIDLLVKNRTKLVVVMENERREFPQLQALLNTRYSLVEIVGDKRVGEDGNRGMRALVYRLSEY